MASRVIGRLPVVYYPQTGKLEVENTGEFVKKQIYQRLDDLAHGQPLHITLTVEPVNKARSTAQNSLMWALLTIMADHYNGGRSGYPARLLPACPSGRDTGRQPLHGQVHTGQLPLYHPRNEEHDRRDL